MAPNKKNNPCFMLLILLIPFIISCSDDEPTKPPDLYSFDKRVFEDITLSSENVIVAENEFGNIDIDAQSYNNIISVYLYKTIHAESRDLAEENFQDIYLANQSQNDTMFTQLILNENPDINKYNCGVYLTVPYQKDCVILWAANKITVSDLVSTLKILDSAKDIEVFRHAGSSDINSNIGNIQVETAIPTGGRCKVKTVDGDIILNIPIYTSASISASSQTGAVEYENLIISSLNQQNSSLSGNLGSTLGTIELETVNGNIFINGFPNENIVEVQFDLQEGFGNQTVTVKEDDIIYFQSFIESEPFSGPDAYFTTLLSRGKHFIELIREQDSTVSRDTTEISIGRLSDKYWVGYIFYPDTIITKIQDTAFGYF